MGFVLLGIATLTADRRAGRADRQHRPRHHHRPAVLPGRRDQGPDPHRRAGRARRPAGDGAGAGRAARVRGDRLARAARAGRLLGRGVRRGRRVQPRRSAVDRAGRAGRGRRGAGRRVLPAPAAPGHATARAAPARRPRRARRALPAGRAGRLGAAGACWRSRRPGAGAGARRCRRPVGRCSRWWPDETIDQVALLPAYAPAGTAVLAFLADLVVPGRRGRSSR